MCQPKRWLWGLIPLAILWLLSGSFNTSPIQTDLTKRSGESVTVAGHPWAKLAFDGRDATLSGTAPTPDAQRLASEAAYLTRGVRLVNNTATVLAEANPWTWTAVRDAAKVTLGGFVPNEAARASIVADTKKAVPNAEVVDQMKLARGVTPVFGAAVAHSLAQLGRLPDGKANLSAAALTITGTAPSPDIYQAATGATRPAGLTGADTVALPTVRPYQWQAQKAGSTITLTGLAPSAEAKTAIATGARASAPNATVVDQMRLANGAPNGFAGMTTAAFGHLAGLSTGIANLTDANYSIIGAAPSMDVLNTVTAASKALPTGFALAKADITSPVVSPYTWSAKRNAAAVTLSGNVPSDAVKSANVAAARAAVPNATVTDQQVLSAGAPNGFQAMTTYAIGQLGRLNAGEANLSNTAYTLTGIAPSVQVKDASVAATATLPTGFTLAKADITASTISPYTWSATRNAAAITLSGFVPSDAVKTANVAAARAAIPNALVTDQQTLGAGAPNGFQAMTSYAIGQLGRLNSGVASLSNTAYTLTGAAPTGQVRDQSVAGMATLPAGFTLARQEITAPAPPPPPAPAPVVAAPPPPPPAPPAPPAQVAVTPPPPPPLPVVPVPAPVVVPVPAPVIAPAPVVAPAPAPVVVVPAPVVITDTCQPRFNALLNEPILFDVNKDTIRPVSYVLLGRLAAVAKSCPTRNIEIGAHTDSDGIDAYNQDLSERRAKAVVEFLVRDGVAGTLLKAVGYGETKPIAPNDSPANKQKNRRVEFTVK